MRQLLIALGFIFTILLSLPALDQTEDNTSNNILWLVPALGGRYHYILSEQGDVWGFYNSVPDIKNQYRVKDFTYSPYRGAIPSDLLTSILPLRIKFKKAVATTIIFSSLSFTFGLFGTLNLALNADINKRRIPLYVMGYISVGLGSMFLIPLIISIAAAYSYNSQYLTGIMEIVEKLNAIRKMGCLPDIIFSPEIRLAEGVLPK